MDSVKTFLYERVWLSKKSTILGLLVFAVTQALIYAQGPGSPKWLQLIAVFVTVPFLAWKDEATKSGVIKLGMIFFLFSYAASAAGGTPAARNLEAAVLAGDVPPPPAPVTVDPAPASPSGIGGCIDTRGRAGRVCVGPTVALTMAAINLTKKSVEGAFSPGAGLGLTFNTGQWYSAGVGFYLNLDPGAQNASVAGLLSILNGYARIGYSKGFIGDVSARIVIGSGIDL